MMLMMKMTSKVVVKAAGRDTNCGKIKSLSLRSILGIYFIVAAF